MNSMADALSSASLLLAAIALVYSAWSASIDTEATRAYSAQPETKADEKAQTCKVLNGRARPMLIVSALVFVAFLDRDWRILRDTGAWLSDLMLTVSMTMSPPSFC